jgi:glycosyltransferase involved in cell wall biosynthesis
MFRAQGWKAWTGGSTAETAIMDGGEDAAGWTPEQIGALLLEHQRRSPDSPLLICDAGLPLPAHSIEALNAHAGELHRGGNEAWVLTALSNADTELNPWSGLEPAASLTADPGLAEKLVALLGPGLLHRYHRWPEHLLLLSTAAVQLLAQDDLLAADALSILNESKGQLLVADNLFIRDSRQELFEQSILEPHEQRRPMPWGLLSQRLDAWLRSDLAGLPEFGGSSMKVPSLHISHSWGGGIGQWVESFIQADGEGHNLQLRSEGPQSGQGAGQRLSLYFGNKTDCPIASWWLQPPIKSSVTENEQYRGIVLEITRRYRVGRVIVSSLVGHSLDALNTGLPTIQVLHDFYPCWPLLGTHPGQYLENGHKFSLQHAMQEHQLLPDFRGRNAKSWKNLASAWREAISIRGIKVVAPSQSVATMLRRMDPAWAEIDIEIIPHGLPAMPGGPAIEPREREDGKLRLLVLGRVQQGKGRDILLEALPELSSLAHIYLVGAGKEGEVFFGKSGVDVILQYRREDLPAILATIGPQAGALLSVVPETFSYTLSELQQFNIPVVATRVGSLEERITDGETGWLIEPGASALVEKVKFLSDNRHALQSMRSRLSEFSHPDATGMVEKYDRLCPSSPAGKQWFTSHRSTDLQLDSLAWEQLQLTKQVRELRGQSQHLEQEVEERTRWAEDTKRALAEEQKRRDRWVKSLNEQLDERYEELQAARRAFNHERNLLEQHKSLLEQSHVHFAHLKAKHDWVLDSTSWRITRPFRVSRRILGNFIQARAWNPLRWPLLLSQAFRTLKTQGPHGALMRSQVTHKKTFIPTGFEPEQVEEIGSPDAPASFPAISNPDVSIVIPVFNKWIYTAACLRSLAETPCRASFEVIVVDDRHQTGGSGWSENNPQ